MPAARSLGARPSTRVVPFYVTGDADGGRRIHHLLYIRLRSRLEVHFIVVFVSYRSVEVVLQGLVPLINCCRVEAVDAARVVARLPLLLSVGGWNDSMLIEVAHLAPPDASA